jgi:hypothetical protein
MKTGEVSLLGEMRAPKAVADIPPQFRSPEEREVAKKAYENALMSFAAMTGTLTEVSPKIPIMKGKDLIGQYKTRGEPIHYEVEEIAKTHDFIKTKLDPKNIKGAIEESLILQKGSPEDVTRYRRIVASRSSNPVVIDSRGNILDGYKRVANAIKQGTLIDAYIAKPKQQVIGAIPKSLEPLAKEARKYKSAEEFFEAAKNKGMTSPTYYGAPESYEEYLVKYGGGKVKRNAPKVVQEAFKTSDKVIRVLRDGGYRDFYNQATKFLKK